jgi:hypothetical protein
MEALRKVVVWCHFGGYFARGHVTGCRGTIHIFAIAFDVIVPVA